MLDQVIAIMKEMENKPEMFEVTARLMRKMYESLVKVGFTPDEAIRIVASQGTGMKVSG